MCVTFSGVEEEPNLETAALSVSWRSRAYAPRSRTETEFSPSSLVFPNNRRADTRCAQCACIDVFEALLLLRVPRARVFALRFKFNSSLPK